MNQTNPTSWLCTGGTPMRAGDRHLCIWWDVANQQEANEVIALIKPMTASDLKAAYTGGIAWAGVL